MSTTSIVDYLNSKGQDSSFSARKKLAEESGVVGYTGSAAQNIGLINTLSSKVASPVPKTPVLNDDAPTSGGASGRFDPNDVNEEQAKEIDALYNQATEHGAPSSEVSDYYSDPNYRIPEPKISAEEARIFGRSFGGGNEFAGLTRAQAEAKNQAKKDALGNQQSQRTSYTFNPEATSGAKKILDNFSFKLNENKNNSFKGAGSKADFSKGLLESTANDFAKLFTSKEAFDAQLKDNPQFQNSINDFVKNGGDLNSISSRITAPAVATVVAYKDNPDGTTTNSLSDGTEEVIRYQKNPDGSLTPIEVSRTQDTASYLASLSPDATPAQRESFNSMIPERQLAQDQIMQIAQIPKDLQGLYFGTPQKIGLYEEKRIQAEEYKKILETKAENAKEDARTQASLAIEKNNADLQIESSKVEENRLRAKNYMTGMLAKMGALNTTGAAVMSLGILDQKYEQEASLLRTKVQYENKATQAKLTEVIHDLENTKEEKVYNLQTDLTKTKEDVLKEILKVNQSSAKEIFSIMSKYTTSLRIQTDKYSAIAKKDAEAYAKKYAKLAGKYNLGSLNRSINSSKGKNGFKNEWTRKLEASKDIGNEADGQYSDPAVYNKTFDAFVDKGGTMTEFKKMFKPTEYINPKNTTIDPQFRTTPKEVKKGSGGGSTPPTAKEKREALMAK